MKRTSTLRRTGFSLKPRKAMKRGTLRKKSTQSISLLQRKIWELCKQITRTRHGNVCYTCGKGGLEGSNWHTGHMIAKGSLPATLKYDLRVLRPQCYDCNINKGGMGADFYRKMIIEIGATAMNEIILDRQKTVNARSHYEKIYLEYQEIWRGLQAN